MAQNPFSLSPDPAYLYLTDALHMMCDKVRFTLDERQGLTVTYGDVGTGKSTLMRMLYNEYDAREDCTAISLVNPKFSTELNFLKGICGEFGVPVKHSRMAQEAEFKAFLIDEFEARRNVVVFIDEAQNLKGEVLELVRSLLNFETDSAKLISIALFGQLELRDRLRDKSKKYIRSRIFLYSVLEPLTIEDTESMLRFRCERARVKLDFQPDAVREVFQLARGIPRDTLKLCSTVYHFAKSEGRAAVDAELVAAAGQHTPIGEEDDA